jgi:phosphoserine phosphatase RsbU/P
MMHSNAKSQQTHVNKLLIVEDSVTDQLVLASIIEGAGYAVYCANSAEVALEILSREMIDLVLLDLMLPGVSGFDFIQQIRAQPNYDNVPIIVQSGNDDMDSKMRAFKLGVADYITKPFQSTEVLARLKVHLNNSFLLQRVQCLQQQLSAQIQKGQQNFLVQNEDVPDVPFDVFYKPFHIAGGDFYDVIKITADRVGFFVGDVSGHEISTSYIVAAVKTLLRQNCNSSHTPQSSMQAINNVLVSMLKPEQFVSACYAEINYGSMELSVISMGHPPLVYVPKGGNPHLVSQAGEMLGLFANVHWPVSTLAISAEDMFILCTDGILETHGALWNTQLNTLTQAAMNIGQYEWEGVAQSFATLVMKEQNPNDDVVVLVAKVDHWEGSHSSPMHETTFFASRDAIDAHVNEHWNFISARIKMAPRYELKLVLYEALSNAVIHGNQENSQKKVWVCTRVQAKSCTIIVRDEGCGFDWKYFWVQPNVSTQAIGGRGLHLMQDYGYKVQFNSLGNEIKISKSFEFM